MEAGERLLDAFAGRLRHLHVSSVDDGCRHVPLTAEHEARYAALLRRCPDVPWILEAPLREARLARGRAARAAHRRALRRGPPRRACPTRFPCGRMSAAAGVTMDPSGALERLGGELPEPARGARAHARGGRRPARGARRRSTWTPPPRVVLFGSWGRGELTRRSDDDWAVLVEGAERPGVAPGPEALAAALGGAARRPGAAACSAGGSSARTWCRGSASTRTPTRTSRAACC